MYHQPPGVDPLLGRAQIAALAGVSRPTVTNWEKQDDFPSPRRGNGQDLFRSSEVLDWLDRRTVPSARLAAGEETGTTYGRRARRTWTMGERSAAAFPPPTDGAIRRAPTDRASAPDPSDLKVVQELMGSLVDRVRGAASTVDYLNLLLCLHYLRGVDESRWAAMQSRARTLNGLDAASRLLRDVGRATDEDMRGFAVDSRMAEALTRLEPRTARDLRQVFDGVSRLRGNVFRMILDEYEQRAALGSREFFTPRAVVQLMTRLACAGFELGQPCSVYDPYARGGEFLIEAAAAFVQGKEGTQGPVVVRVEGETTRADTWRLASLNLLLHGVPPKVELRRTAPWGGDSRRGPLAPADIVLTNPPFNMSDPARPERREGRWPYGAPPVDNDNFAYVQHCLTMLREGGRAGIIMPNKAGNSGHKAEREIRRQLIDDGAVECVIALPTHLFSGTAVPVSVWLLRRPGVPSDRVLFVDASDLGVKSDSRRVLRGEDVESLLGIVGAYLSGGREAGDSSMRTARVAVPNALVSTEELRARAYSLNPLDHIRRDRTSQTNHSTGLHDAWKHIHVLRQHLLRVEEAVGRLPHVDSRGTSADLKDRGHPSTTLNDLCYIQAGPSYTKLGRKQRTMDGDVPVVFPRHLKGGYISDARDELVRVETAHLLQDFSLREGDIVCVRSGAIGPPALVRDEQTGWLMSPNVIRLRVKARDRVSPEYLMYYLCREESVDWMRDRAAGTAAPSIRTESLGNLRLPLPSLQEQTAIASMLVSLDELDRAHQKGAASARQARTFLADALMGSRLEGAAYNSHSGPPVEKETSP